MNPWNLLLESLHSALIDELCERAPEPKPELGMPVRAASLTPPSGAFERVMACRLSLAGGAGFAVLALDPGAETHAKATASALWAGLLERAVKAEFPRRNIAPEFEDSVEVKIASGFPPAWPKPRLAIWFPIGLNGGMSYLGVAI